MATLGRGEPAKGHREARFETRPERIGTALCFGIGIVLWRLDQTHWVIGHRGHTDRNHYTEHARYGAKRVLALVATGTRHTACSIAEQFVNHTSHGGPEIAGGRIFQQVCLIATHDRGGQGLVVLPVLEVERANVGIDTRQVVTDFWHQNHSAFSVHDVIVHDDEQQQRPAEHSGEESTHAGGHKTRKTGTGAPLTRGKSVLQAREPPAVLVNIADRLLGLGDREGKCDLFWSIQAS